MKIRRFFNDVKKAIRDPERELSERLFIALTIVSELACLVAFIVDIITQENIGELVVLALTVFDALIMWVLKMRAMLAKIPNALVVKLIGNTVDNVVSFRVCNDCRNDYTIIGDLWFWVTHGQCIHLGIEHVLKLFRVCGSYHRNLCDFLISHKKNTYLSYLVSAFYPYPMRFNR